ncbi:MAG TPA: ATP phosphoribosyltransferase regulatory subunit [Streptosporangiaceae bacterium]|nr:ATP phosphoribosyltransferase regulatory subunit [Streptosporangiaceae bacterium]
MPHRHPISLPPGAVDLSGAAVRRRRDLQRAALEVLGAAGYQEVLPPSFEYEEAFLRAGGPSEAERLIRFVDRDGRVLALRYDYTASLARMAATTFADSDLPLRLCYSGSVFRQDPERDGRPREIRQVGAELLGVAGLDADVEIVRLTLALANAAGLRDFQINLGHVGVLAAGLAALGEDLRPEIRRWIDRKDRASLGQALAGQPPLARTLLTLPFVMGRRPALEAVVRTAPPEAHPGLAHLIALDAALTPEERSHLVYDLGEVRGLEYYTGIHFELFIAGAGRAAGAGGRYDDLMAKFGRPRPAVGVAFELDTISESRP